MLLKKLHSFKLVFKVEKKILRSFEQDLIYFTVEKEIARFCLGKDLFAREELILWQFLKEFSVLSCS